MNDDSNDGWIDAAGREQGTEPELRQQLVGVVAQMQGTAGQHHRCLRTPLRVRRQAAHLRARAFLGDDQGYGRAAPRCLVVRQALHREALQFDGEGLPQPVVVVHGRAGDGVRILRRRPLVGPTSCCATRAA